MIQFVDKKILTGKSSRKFQRPPAWVRRERHLAIKEQERVNAREALDALVKEGFISLKIYHDRIEELERNKI